MKKKLPKLLPLEEKCKCSKVFVYTFLALPRVVVKQHKTPNNTMKAKPQIVGYTFFAR